MIADPEHVLGRREMIPGFKDWSLTVAMPTEDVQFIPPGGVASVRMVRDNRTCFGFARLVDLEISPAGLAHVRFVGSGPLGTMSSGTSTVDSH